MKFVRTALQLAQAIAPILEHEKTLEALIEEAATSTSPTVNEKTLRYALGLQGLPAGLIDFFIASYIARKR
jgi:hypothetical protein